MTTEVQQDLEENTVETSVEEIETGIESTETVVEDVEEQNSIDVDALFADEELSEEYKSQAKAVFEAVVEERVKEKSLQMQEDFDAKLEEQTETFAEGLVTKVDEYLEYVVSEWLEENKLAVERGIRAEMVEDFMVGLKNLFLENYVDIPEDKVDVVEAFATEVESLKVELDTAINENVTLVSELNSLKKMDIVESVCKGLSEVQVEKVKSLSENVDFESESDFIEKMSLIKQKYFSEASEETSTESLTEDVTSELTEEPVYSELMERYIKNLSSITKS